MKTKRPYYCPRRWAPYAGLLLSGGCLGTFQQNLDILLAPDAFGNALALLRSPVEPVVMALVRLFGG
ncbi:MAG: hypothetical protein KKB50_10485 [Planctomycetes bacterium]|nr:hypothetical protein [Planctomycetota bacterium]